MVIALRIPCRAGESWAKTTIAASLTIGGVKAGSVSNCTRIVSDTGRSPSNIRTSFGVFPGVDKYETINTATRVFDPGSPSARRVPASHVLTPSVSLRKEFVHHPPGSVSVSAIAGAVSINKAAVSSRVVGVPFRSLPLLCEEAMNNQESSNFVRPSHSYA